MMFKFRRPDDWQMITVPQLDGERGSTRVTFINAPFRFSRSRNQTRFVDGDSGPMLSDELLDRQNMYAKCIDITHLSSLCFHCCQVLPDVPVQQARFELPIAYKAFEPFTLIVETPAVRCLTCGTANAEASDERQNEVLEAMLDAFASQNIQ
jgi:hypothetical protein